MEDRIIGKKIEMTQVFREDGAVVPVTEIEIISGNALLEVGIKVNIVGISKGKGFAGGMKRWGFAGGPKTHGQSDRSRAPGSIGAGTDPGRVWKGQKMAGRMGGKRVTVQNSEVVKVLENQHILIKGGVPGTRKSLVELTLVA